VEDGRCALLAWHSLSDPARSETEQTAVNTWQKALTLRHLAPGVRTASVEVDMDAIAAAYAELEQ
jgi:hypothetical protein